jgi:Tol biopolymer transport system component
VGVAIALLLLTTPATSSATFPGANGLIAYSGSLVDPDDSAGDIFTISPRGGEPTQLTDNSVHDFMPSWSADGRWIIFVRWGGNATPIRNAGVWAMRADGSHQHFIFHTRSVLAWPHFSPGGGQIAIAEAHSLATVRTDGSHFQRLLYAYILGLGYSPNGRRIVFSGLPRGSHGQVSIWTVRRDGSDLRRLTHPRGYGVDESPDWSPDGRHIVFAHCGLDSDRGCVGNEFIYSMRPDGSHKRRLHRGFSSLSVSPTGERIALSVGEGYYFDAFCGDIYTIKHDGSGRRFLTHNCVDYHHTGTGGSAGSPNWQPIPDS